MVVEFYMEHQGSQRHLAAILAADIEGYTRLMSRDEGTTLARLTVYRQLISKLVQEQGGRIFGAFADSAMAEFPSRAGCPRGRSRSARAGATECTSGGRTPDAVSHRHQCR